MEAVVLGVFAASLIVCISSGASILWALCFGYLLFVGYGVWRRHPLPAVLQMSLRGMRTVSGILVVFLLIGIITAVWRLSGTIAMIIYASSKLILPSVFVLVSFLLCCLVSVLTGTSFGSAATIGVICMSIGRVMGLSPALLGGAILSGVFFGDRCSPMSTSCLLVCSLTDTDIFRNIRRMLVSCAAPFAICCALYFALGLRGQGAAPSLELLELFPQSFTLHPVTLLPAALIPLLSLFRVNVRRTMTASILAGCAVAVLLQGVGPGVLLRSMLTGYRAADPALAAMLDGGGMLSMAKVSVIVLLSSSYAGIFEGTGLLSGLQDRVTSLSLRITPFGATLVTAVLSAMIACNQSLAILLTDQLCRQTAPDKETFALNLEDTVVVIAPLVPWSIAGAVPLATLDAPAASLLFAFFLYLLPLWRLLRALTGRRRTRCAA